MLLLWIATGFDGVDQMIGHFDGDFLRAPSSEEETTTR